MGIAQRSPKVNRREILKEAKSSFQALMQQVAQSKDAINIEERLLANKISQAEGRFEFESLQSDEIDAAIQLLGYYWRCEEERTEVMIDFLVGLHETRKHPT